MNEALHNLSICPACGSRLVAGSNGALCPACMLQAALAEDPVADDANPQNPGGEQPGAHIGHYKLLEKIGEGGFGIVWMAEQEEPLRRRVALKIIKLGMDTREVIARFEAERQALAMMEHPNIAGIFDGGTTETGLPFFVMELVDGVPITAYCDANQLTTKERLESFMEALALRSEKKRNQIEDEGKLNATTVGAAATVVAVTPIVFPVLMIGEVLGTFVPWIYEPMWVREAKATRGYSSTQPRN